MYIPGMKLQLMSCFFLLFLVVEFKSSPALGQDVESNRIENELILPLVINGTLELDFVLIELEVTQHQKRKLTTAIKKAKKQWVDIVFPEKETEPLSKERKKEVSTEVFQTCHDSIETILRADQYQRLGHILRQRKAGHSAKVDPSLLPMVAIKESSFPKKERALFVKTMLKIKNDFETRKEELKKSCLTELTDGDAEAMEEIRRLALFIEGLRRSSTHLDVSPKKLSAYSARDFDKFEESIFALTTFTIFNNSRFRDELNVLDHQLEPMMSDYVAATNGYPREDFVDRTYFKIVMLSDKYTNVELKRDLREKVKKLNAFEAKLADDLVVKHLLPFQRKQIKQLAKSFSDVFESRYGDFFGLVSAWGETKDINEKSDDFASKIDSVRKKYYSDLAELRTSTWKSGLDALPGNFAKKFKERFGTEVYDYTFEVIQQWNQSRQKSE